MITISVLCFIFTRNRVTCEKTGFKCYFRNNENLIWKVCYLKYPLTKGMCTTKLRHKNVHYYSHYEADTVPTSVTVSVQ